MANQEQLEILKQGFDVWNNWRKENPDVKVDLSKANLREADLYGANLRGANLRESDLSRANLRKANLRKANLTRANLWESNLTRVNLWGSTLWQADLREADLRGAILWDADLREANLSRANLTEANLWRANLTDANLTDANLTDANLWLANLTEANLWRANLTDANLNRKNLSEVQRLQIEEGVDYWNERKAEEELAEKRSAGDSSVVMMAGSAAIVRRIDQYREEVLFTAYHPKEGSVEFWHTLLIYTHILSALEKVQKDAKRFADQILSPKETTSKSSTPITRGTELIIVPSCASVTFNPERVSLKWMEDFHRADFRFKADKSLSGDAAKGSIDIYVGPLIIGTLKFAMLFNDADAEAQPVPDHEEHTKMYGKNDVFISYSRKDSEVARTFKTVLEGTGLDVFLDVDDIRSGQLWEDELKRRIEQAKIFQIFWSANYSQSENCKQEWEYALKQNKDEGYIRPVFWQKPLSPNPPEELNKFNFKYVELKV